MSDEFFEKVKNDLMQTLRDDYGQYKDPAVYDAAVKRITAMTPESMAANWKRVDTMHQLIAIHEGKVEDDFFLNPSKWYISNQWLVALALGDGALPLEVFLSENYRGYPIVREALKVVFDNRSTAIAQMPAAVKARYFGLSAQPAGMDVAVSPEMGAREKRYVAALTQVTGMKALRP